MLLNLLHFTLNYVTLLSLRLQVLINITLRFFLIVGNANFDLL